MRIIGGRLRRRIFSAPKGHLTRPTSDRAKESIFNMVEARLDLDDAHVLDLFAGTGSLGFEALSRGAASATFVEQQAQVMKCLQENAASLDLTDACVFVRADVLPYLKNQSGPPYELVLADPPYDLDTLPRLPDLIVPLLEPGGLLVLEHDSRHRFDDHPAFELSRAYGRTTVSLFNAHEPA
ncbi:MAG: 16S rRNA (guanine(966)-N(2))-methyltransferase RsmD [Rhodothermales bacterium]